jgi:uridine phosphorylase
MEDWLVDIDYRQANDLEGKLQYHIQCQKGDVAPVVIVPGDQGRVEKIIAKFDDCRKIAENRGLITYTGTYKNVPMSVTSTGMGGPGAAIVYEELINIGARALVRIGSVAALQPEINIGDTVIPYGCIRDDGVTRYYIPENYPAVATPFLHKALVAEAEEHKVKYWAGINWTHSAFFARSKKYFQQWANKGVISMDMEASALMIITQLRKVEGAFVGTVYQNRYNQTHNAKMDLSVGSPKSEAIELGNERSIGLALDALARIYRNI